MKHINRITALLVIILFAVAFALSYHAISDLATQNGIAYGVLYPILLDGFIVTAALFRLRNSLRGSTTRADWLLVAAATIASIAFNVLHAPAYLLAQVMAGLIPVALFTSFELLMYMVQEDLQRKQQQHDREQQWRNRTRAVLEAARSASAEAAQYAAENETLQAANERLQARIQKQAERQAERDTKPSVKQAEQSTGAYACACGRTFAKHQALAGHSRFCDAWQEQEAERDTAESMSISSNGHA